MKFRSTLYDITRPLVTLFNIYGFNFGSRKAPGASKTSILTFNFSRFVVLALILGCFVYVRCSFIREDRGPKEYSVEETNWRANLEVSALALILGLNIFGFFHVYFQRDEFNQLIFDLKTFPINNSCYTKTQFPVFLVYGFLSAHAVISIVIFGTNFMYLNSTTVEFLGFLLILIPLVGVNLTALWFLCPLVTLPCVLAIYCSSTVKELVDGAKQVHSPLRRVKLIARLIPRYEGMKETIARADQLFSAPLYLLRMVSLIVFANMSNLFENSLDQKSSWSMALIVNSIVTPYVILMLMYLVVAPFANSKIPLLARLLAEVTIIKDETIRFEYLVRVVYLRMGDGWFTLSGTSADGGMLSELNDMHNLINDYIKS